MMPRTTFAVLEPISAEQRTTMIWALHALRDARLRRRSLVLLDGERGGSAYSNIIEALGWIAALDDRLTWHHGDAYLRARDADRRGRVVAALQLLRHRLPAEVPLAARRDEPEPEEDVAGHTAAPIGGSWTWRPLDELPEPLGADPPSAMVTYRREVEGEIVDRPVYRGELWFVSLVRARCSVLSETTDDGGDVAGVASVAGGGIPRPRRG